MGKLKQLAQWVMKIFFSRREINRTIPRFVPTQKSFLDRTLYIHDISSFHLGELEIFKNEVYRFLPGNSNPVIIDCGSNLGMSVIYFKELYPDASITAFEPDPYIFGFLKKNMESFGYANVELINKAVWIEDGTLSFLEEGGAGGRIQNNNSSQNDKYISVSSVRLKDFLENKKVDFLKLDIEGAEYEVLKDCTNDLQLVSNLFIEYHSFIDQSQDLDKILEIVSKAGFRYHLKEASDIQFPFLDRPVNNGMDSQINIFCFRN